MDFQLVALICSIRSTVDGSIHDYRGSLTNELSSCLSPYSRIALGFVHILPRSPWSQTAAALVIPLCPMKLFYLSRSAAQFETLVKSCTLCYVKWIGQTNWMAIMTPKTFARNGQPAVPTKGVVAATVSLNVLLNTGLQLSMLAL